MPNSFAYLVLLAWPVLAVIAFRRLPLAAAIVSALLGAFLLVPAKVGIDLPVLPELNKDTTGVIAAILVIIAVSRSQQFLSGGRSTPSSSDVLPGWLPRSPLALACIGLLIAGGTLTALLNPDPLVYGKITLPGMSTYDLASFLLSQGVMLLPFLIARKYLAAPEAQRLFLVTLVVAAAIYAFPALFEVRMSPQLNRMIYGFFPHSFFQHVRGDGYRPLVFLSHGLRLSLFFAISVIAALALFRYGKKERRPMMAAVSLFLFVTLYLSKSLGALGIAVLFAPVVLLASKRIQLLFAASITAVALVYPVLRGNDLVPIDSVVNAVASIDEKRADSLSFRLHHEDDLLEKANEKALFGWGIFGRSRIYSESGKSLSVTDGTWVILFGTGGWALYLATFGLLCLPVLLLAYRQKTLQPEGMAVAMALLMAANMIDLIPNSGLTVVTWMLAGALWGRLEWKRADVHVPEPDRAQPHQALFVPNVGHNPTSNAPVANPGSPFTPVLKENKRNASSESKTRGSAFAPRSR